MTNPTSPELDYRKIKALLAESLRSELGKMIADENCAAERTDDDIDDRIEKLEAEIKKLRRAARRNDFECARAWLEPAARTTSLRLPDALATNVGREVLGAMKQLAEVAIEVEEGRSVAEASRQLVERHTQAPVEKFVEQSPLISSAVTETTKLYPKSMHSGIRANGKLLIEFFGDVPIDLLTKDRQKDFFAFVARLPKDHGRSHGNNRFVTGRKGPSKHDEITMADIEDALITEEIRAMEGLSLHEKKARLAERLTPRVTFANIYKHRDSVQRLCKGAAELGAGAELTILSRKEIDRHLEALAPDDELYVRVAKPKVRTAWTEERLAKFLTSPLYTGCYSPERRWRPGKLIVRDATYWMPLLIMFLGSRIEELLQLKRQDIIKRNGVYGLRIGRSAEQRTKNDDSKRFLPLPQILLELGFVDWFQKLPMEHGPLLFPEAAARSSTGTLSGAFGKHMRLILARLGVGSPEEDFYALRKTLLSSLERASVPNETRQAIAGHKHKDIINTHYTAENAAGLKRALDRADFGLVIAQSEEHGFPVITDCELAPAAVFDADLELGEEGQAATLRVTNADDGEEVFVAAINYGAESKATHSGKRPILAARVVAERLSEFEDKGCLRPPQHQAKRIALESLMALG